MKLTKTQITGWVLSYLTSVFLIFVSAIPKFLEWDGKSEMFNHLGYSSDTVVKIGILEIVLAIVYVIPRTGFLGAVLLTAYLGGATATHVRVGDPFIFPIIMGIIAWIALGLRRPEVFSLAFGSTEPRVVNGGRAGA